MLGTRLFAVSASLLGFALAACGDDGGDSTELRCAGETSGTIDGPGDSVAVSTSSDLDGAAVAAENLTTPPGNVSIACAPADIVPEGFVALGPAVSFGAEGTWSDRPFKLTLPYKAARLPANAEKRHVRIVAKREGQEPFFPAVSNVEVDHTDEYKSRVTFRGGELTTYQVVAKADAGTQETYDFKYRAVVGISMGGFAANSIGLRHSDKFDIIADIGGDPGPSQVYFLAMVRDFLYGGFCTAEDEAAGRGNIGELCPKTMLRSDQFEIGGDYEHQISQEGDGVGLTLRRSLYVRASRDLARALGNPALYNMTNPYTPPGVDMTYIDQPAATRCGPGGALRLENFYDREFNPTGSDPVITFCDGVDQPGMLGVFNPSADHGDPAEVLLAVDLNDNGKRDAGEPVITNAYEPFSDVGTDGLASTAEPGYDPVTNPDPNKDDYHYLRNPLGLEGNGDFDTGEPYEDFGLDGVQGTCQQPTAGCYDYGEGNGTWDLSPNIERWYSADALRNFAALPDEAKGRMSFWYDAGIRDFLNNSLGANITVAGMMAKHQLPFGINDSFKILAHGTSDAAYDFTEIDWTEMPKNLYIRYGNPEATPEEIDRGDGRHVGTAVQIINRAQTAFAWMNRRWPDGDYTDTFDGGEIIKGLEYTSPSTGRVSPYGIFLPPGYSEPQNANARYPVIYFLHGYGQEPQDLVDLSNVFALYMNSERAIEVRFQKFIIVYVDGRCRPQIDGVPVDPAGDLCEGGTFYMDAPLGGPAQMETHLLELMEHIDATYRTKSPMAGSIVP